MKTNIYLPGFFLLLSMSLQAQYNEKNLSLGSPAASSEYRFGNLQLYPVHASRDFHSYHRDVARFVTLKEALTNNKVKITEHPKGDVNTLFIENTSADTVVILAGEVVQGGKQDRMIATDFILYPQSGKKDISVFCVEHGRWQEKGTGKSFQEYYTISSNEVRKAGAVQKDQQEVWKKVSENTTKNNAGSSSGTLAALKHSESFNASLKEYVDHFEKMMREDADVVGLVAVSGDRVLGCDMFATHGLFRQHYPNLINSYATEAITSGKPVSISYDEVGRYLLSIIADEKEQDEKIKRNGTLLKEGKNKLHISTF